MTKVDALLQKGMASLRSGRFDDAERNFRYAVEADPGHFGALNLLTVALTSLRRFDEAERFAERALKIDASSDATFYNYGVALQRNNKPALAAAAYDRALAINPRHAKALNNRGALNSQRERYEDAIADFDRAVAVEPRYGEAFYNKANALMAVQRHEEALLNFERALSLDPRNAAAYANLIIVFVELGDYDKAAECGRRAIALDPDLTDAYLSLAAMEEGRSQPSAALQWLDALVERRPDHLRGLCARASRLVLSDRLDEARRDLERARTIAPRDATERAELSAATAALLLADGRKDEAIAAYESVVEAPNECRERLMLMLASTFETFGLKDQALRAFDLTLESYPSSVRAWRGRAELVKFAPGDPSIAKMEALLAPEAHPPYSARLQISFALGKALLDTGNSAAAFRHLHEGNRLKRAAVSYDSEATTRRFAAVAETFTSALLKRLGGTRRALLVADFRRRHAPLGNDSG